MFTTRPRSITIAAYAALLAATPAAAQVLQIGDDGLVVVNDGPTITTSDGTVALLAAPRLAIARSPEPVLHRKTALSVEFVTPDTQINLLFSAAARNAGLDPRLLHAVAWQESRFHHEAVSSKGAIGIMQLMPATASRLGVDPRNLVQNVVGGARLLAGLLRRYSGNLDLALSAYNAGPEAVRRYGGVPPFAETRKYVRRIKQSLSL